MKSSPMVRAAMAAGLYLLLMWGYLVLPNAQWFAAFLALVMSTMLVFWVTEAVADVCDAEVGLSRKKLRSESHSAVEDSLVDISSDTVLTRSSETSLDASILRLDALKSELNEQYAQFGRDQSSINGKGLGFWHRKRRPRSP